MPDISMCLNRKCPLRMTCYRYRARPNPWWQPVMDFEYDEQKQECLYFMEIYHEERCVSIAELEQRGSATAEFLVATTLLLLGGCFFTYILWWALSNG